MGTNAEPLGVVSHAGDVTKMTDSPRGTKGCSGIEGVVGGLASIGHHALYSVPLRRNPVSQPLIYGDLNSGPVAMNFGSQGGAVKQEDSVSPVPNAVDSASAHAAFNTARWSIWGQTVPVTLSE